MTTYKGIAAVTQTLGYLVDSAIRSAVPEASVTLARPEESAAGSADQPRLNLYLVQVLPEATMRSNDLPTRDDRGGLLAVPQAPVNLRYLLSFFGPSQKAHLMLGATELALRERATLDSTLIRRALANHPDLQDSGLEEQIPQVRIVPSAVTLEELSRFWSGFLQMPYTVSTLYEATTVILTSTQSPAAALPVSRVGGGTGAPSPQLDPLPSVQFTARPPGTVVPVSGRGITSGQHVNVSGQWLALVPREGGGFQFTLPDDAAAGQQIVRLGSAAPGGEPRPIPGSPSQLLVVRPALREVQMEGPNVSVTVAPPLRPGQEAVLNLVGAAPGDDLTTASARSSTTAAAPTRTLTFARPKRLPAGPYLALLEVDGVTSLPVIEDGRYAGPILELAR